ncbi:DMSO/selenate family reductase complex A subunit [Slackia heliotrinireducens]|uniref:DMSO/selenate family reductase complex A subunit n=1 Tax=Slackia heliotrinireducens TaxID=84110 RepID=UPI003316322E
MVKNDELTVSRRKFVKGSFAGAVATAGVLGGASMFGCSPSEEGGETTAPESAEEAASMPAPNALPEDEIVWSQCNLNCGGRCVFQWHVQDGKITFMETDNIGDDEFQSRACLRGRSWRRWVNYSDRLLYPMKRVGKRGSGEFEQISWDEAIQTIADKLKEVIDTYGNEAVYINYATGMYSATGRTLPRLMNLIGGYLPMYGDYSTAQITAAAPYTYGPVDSFNGSPMKEAENSDLVVMFGNSPAETRMGGLNTVWDFAKVREAVESRGGKIYNIDYRLNETVSGHPDEWFPIRSGTDAALVNALAWQFINDDAIDKDFLDKYCVGFDEDTMPDDYKGKNMSYKDYIMGTGYDMVEKTPEWAAPICGASAEAIRQLAADLEAAEAPYVVQGWGPQRHSNGEQQARAICMVPILLGKIGLPGTNTGLREAMPGAPVGTIPSGENPVTKVISCYQWVNAIDHGAEMTALADGVQGADKLDVPIKFMWNYAGNCITNQHGEINYVHEVLSDETKCEMIVVCDTVMTDSAKYADILLPDAMRAEQLNMSTNGYSEFFTGVCVGGPAQEAPGECRPSYDWIAEIADKFGVKEQFTEGLTQEEWIRRLYEEGAAANENMPTWDEILEQGLWKEELPSFVALEGFRNDPEANPLSTPSGKIEIFSADLQNIADTWELEDGDIITGIPIYDPGRQQFGNTTDEFPLCGTGFHHKSRTHSSFGFMRELEQVARQQMWINPIDADARGIVAGDICAVKSPQGEIRIEAKVTSRIIPGTIAIPQGAWHKADMFGDQIDEGGCANTLSMQHPSPLAKGNPSHSFICEVAKA